MPYTINGFGTTICAARGQMSWHKKGSFEATDYDAIECVCALYLPLIPFRAIHVFGKSSQGTGYNYHQVPIQWSWGLVLRAFIARWLWVPFAIGAFLGVFQGFDIMEGKGGAKPELIATIAGLIGFSLLGWWLLKITDRRNRDLRRIMGPSEVGSSDPATWNNTLLDSLPDPQQLVGATSFEAAISRLKSEGHFGRAMLAARLCVATEDRVRGEELTNEILRDPEVRDALAEVHQDPKLWPQYFAGPPEQNVSASSAPHRAPSVEAGDIEWN
ncbi:MAG: hypothetical protein KDA80_03655 [Planctomycetaceae bacterium]|nr:hypothetical protein [Planctomycetaceae bacterium]